MLNDVPEDLRASFAGQYEIERELAGGGMSRLFLATERGLGRQVVIKVLPPELTSAVGAARFRRETEVTARLQHPHILPILSAGASGDLLYYVMPFVAGESLRARMAREGALPLAEALRLLVEVADALACAHEAGIIHRDLKPENVLLQSGHALLADFGVAAALGGEVRRAGEQKLTRTGTSPGTVGYMAPEQLASDGEVDARADVYSLGVVAWELLAGRRLFEAENAQALLVAHLVDDPEALDVVRFDVPGHVARTVERALAKKPAERWQTAAELRDALQRSLAAVVSAEGGVVKDPLGRRMKVAARRFRSSMTTQRMTLPEGVAAQRSLRRRWLGLAGVLLLVAVAGGGVWRWRSHAAAAPTEIVSVAVAPFQVLSPEPVPELELWREGIVDVMARNLDGAGTVRTIPPAVVLRRATRPIGQRDAANLAMQVGARYAVVGTFTPTSGDSVRVRAWLVEAAADSVIAERTWVLRDVRLAPDSLSLAILESLGERHRLGATDARMHLAGVSPLALREFLRGEQYYRRTAWDSALAAYTRATAQDSTFALPARRIALVREWQFGGVDSMAIANALRAGRFARGLPPRDSLLVVADSIAAALNVRTDWTLARRLFATVDAAASRHPDDPEVWYAVGEARFHHGYGRLTGVTEQGALDAFDRSIALDSSFAPAYVHAVELALRLDGAGAAARRSRPYLALGPSDEHAAAIRLVDRLIDPARAGDATTARLLDSLPLEVVRRAWYQMARWRDTAEVGVRLLSVMDRRQRRDTPRLRSFLSLQYAYRGRFAEAYNTMAGRPSRLYAEMALIGALPPAHADSVLERWIPIDSAGHAAAVRTALAWWAAAGDVQALERVRVEYARRRAAAQTDDARRAALASLRALEAYQALARRDTSAALRVLDALPDTLCLGCYVDRLTHGRLLAASGRLSEADVVLRERLWTFVTPIEVLFLLERARVHARLGRRAEAARGYDMVIEAWQRGDQGSAQRYVTAARAERAALGAGSVAAAPAQR